MGQREVERAIRSVQKHIADFQPCPPHGDVYLDAAVNDHETSTRYIIIDPILRSLGWDLSDPLDCAVEHRVKMPARPSGFGRPDYLLLGSPSPAGAGVPVVVIDAKRIDVPSDDEIGLEQMDGYLDSIHTAKVAVVTNGQYWEIGRRVRNGWKRESDYPLGLHWDDVAENAIRLRKYPEREVYRGSALMGGRGGF